MNRRRGIVSRPTVGRYARVAQPSCSRQDHDCQLGLDHVVFAAIPQGTWASGLRRRRPARSMASYNFHRLAVRGSVRGSSNQVLKRTAANSGVPLSISLAAA
jgi:hypothetical protein